MERRRRRRRKSEIRRGRWQRGPGGRDGQCGAVCMLVHGYFRWRWRNFGVEEVDVCTWRDESRKQRLCLSGVGVRGSRELWLLRETQLGPHRWHGRLSRASGDWPVRRYSVAAPRRRKTNSCVNCLPRSSACGYDRCIIKRQQNTR